MVEIKKKSNSVHYTLYVDGAARNNPGPAGAGICLLRDLENNDEVVFQQGFFLGTKTNNQAEYLALLLGLFYSKQYLLSHDLLTIISDSQLLIRQLKGEYKVKHPQLKELYSCALSSISYISCFNVTFTHVLRDQNKVADALANKGIDKKIGVPYEFFAFCRIYTECDFI